MLLLFPVLISVFGIVTRVFSQTSCEALAGRSGDGVNIGGRRRVLRRTVNDDFHCFQHGSGKRQGGCETRKRVQRPSAAACVRKTTRSGCSRRGLGLGFI